MSRLAEYPHGHKMSDKLRQNKKSLKQNCFYISMLYTQAHTWVYMAFQWLTNTAVVVAGQLVTCVALTVVRALCVHTSVRAVVGQGTLISVCRETQTRTVAKIWAVGQITKKQPLQKLGTSFNHALKWRRERVTYPHNGLRSSGSPWDTGRCRNLWCWSTSVQDHRCVCLSHIHLCLQQTHKTNTERKRHTS